MNPKSILRNVYFRLIGKPQLSSSEAYLNWLRQKGIRIGKGTTVLNVNQIWIDHSRPELLEIGDNVFLHKGTAIMTHDWGSWVFVNQFNDFLPSHGPIKIGNNVWFGEDVTILKNVTIGNNVIIGAKSVVTKSIPDDSIAVGCPAKVINNLSDYYDKRLREYADEAIDYAVAIYRSGRTPKVEDFHDDYPAFVDGRNYMEYNYPYSRIFTPQQFEKWKLNHHAPFNGFDEFMNAVKAKLKQNT